MPDRDGRLADVALGFDTLEPYLTDSPYFGALIGRYGNRIGKGRFALDGKTYQLAVNDGDNHLHGGAPGFDKVLWTAAIEGDGLVLRYRSPDGEQGYPGKLDATVTYSLTDDNEIVVRFHAVDRPADAGQPDPAQLFQPARRGGQGDILRPRDHASTPTASCRSTPARFRWARWRRSTGTPFDFRQPRPIGERIGQPDKQLRHGSGYDHCWVLNRAAAGDARPAARRARARADERAACWSCSPRNRACSSTAGTSSTARCTGKGHAYYRSGFCIEPEHFPDSPNQPAYPNTILRPGEVVRDRVALRVFGGLSVRGNRFPQG